MAYTINLTDGTVFATVNDGTVNTASSMTLVGKNYAGYGEFLDENFIHLLENGSNTSLLQWHRLQDNYGGTKPTTCSRSTTVAYLKLSVPPLPAPLNPHQTSQATFGMTPQTNRSKYTQAPALLLWDLHLHQQKAQLVQFLKQSTITQQLLTM
jgi:hypothetical protein